MSMVNMESKINESVDEFKVEKSHFCGTKPKLESVTGNKMQYCCACERGFTIVSSDMDRNYHSSVEENVNDLRTVFPDLHCNPATVKQEMDHVSDEIANQPCTPTYKTEPDNDEECYSYFANDMFEATDTKFSISSDCDTDQICWNSDSDRKSQQINDQSSTDIDSKPIVKWKLFENKPNSDKEKNWNLQAISLKNLSPSKIQPKPSNKFQNSSRSIEPNKKTVSLNDVCHSSINSSHNNILESHAKSLRTITRKLIFFCDMCGTGFSYKSTLIAHLKKLHFEQVKQCFSCDLCGKRYKKKGHIARHILTAHIKSMHDCLACGEKFKEKRGLTVHIERFHSGSLYKFKCEKCKQNFKSISNYKDHKLNVHSSISDICTCDICGNQYKNKIRLRVHKNRVHCEYRYQCKKCGKAFKRNCHLKVHTNYHCN